MHLQVLQAFRLHQLSHNFPRNRENVLLLLDTQLHKNKANGTFSLKTHLTSSSLCGHTWITYISKHTFSPLDPGVPPGGPCEIKTTA